MPPSALPVAPVPQMIPIAMLAELQRLMAHNAAVAASGNKPPGSLTFNPYELLAHGVHSSSCCIHTLSAHSAKSLNGWRSLSAA